VHVGLNEIIETQNAKKDPSRATSKEYRNMQ
jgi:hypothetical protein